jgi:hypothetical protein
MTETKEKYSKSFKSLKNNEAYLEIELLKGDDIPRKKI